MGALDGLLTSTVRTPGYKLGGVALALAFNTYTAQKLNQASVDTATGKILTVAQDAVITAHDFEENTCMYSDNTKIGANRYPEHTIGFKLGGRTDDLNDRAETFDLVRTTWVIKTRTNEYLVLGLENGMVSSKNDSGAGATNDDFNGFDVVLTGGERAKALVITKTVFDALAARVTT